MIRRWVFPIVRILLVATIAVALGKLAFFPDPAEEADPTVPTGQPVEPTLVVARGSITNDVSLDATVSADPAVPVKVTAVGTVDELFVAPGAQVAAGDVIFDVKVEIVRESGATVDDEGKPLPSIFRYEKVTTSAAGAVSSIAVISGQKVAIGDVGAQVAPPTLSVSGTLQPAQRYRLLTQPSEASVAVSGGPAPFTCTGLAIRTPLAGASADPGTGSGSTGGGDSPSSGAGGTSTTVSCPVPAGVTVFPGLAATMTLAGGRADGVLVVPTSAVRGAAQNGTVWQVDETGATQERAVGLGLSDGTLVEVTGGIDEGATILQFAPGAAAVAPGNGSGAAGCVPTPDGGLVCQGES